MGGNGRSGKSRNACEATPPGEAERSSTGMCVRLYSPRAIPLPLGAIPKQGWGPRDLRESHPVCCV